MLGWIINKVFDRTVDAAETFMRNDPRFKESVIRAAKAVKKVKDELNSDFDEKYGGTPEELNQKAKSRGMTLESYMDIYYDGCDHRSNDPRWQKKYGGTMKRIEEEAKKVDITPEKYIEIFGIKDVQIDKAEDKP